MEPNDRSVGRGILLVLVTVLVFALSDVATKYLTERWPVPFVLAARYLVNVLILLAVFLPRHGRAVFRTQRTGLVILRGASLSVGSIAMGLALRFMPVGETVAIVYLAPLIVMVAAVPLLGEKVRPAGWIAVALGFAGVVLIARPGGGLSLPGMGLALVTALATAIYHLLSRSLSRSEQTVPLLVFTAVIGLVIFGVMLPWNLPDTLPPPLDLAVLAGLGVLATLGHFLFTAAYRLAPASTLAPFNYVHLVWAAGLGWLVFGHVPEPLAALGIGLVALAGALGAVASARKG